MTHQLTFLFNPDILIEPLEVVARLQVGEYDSFANLDV